MSEAFLPCRCRRRPRNLHGPQIMLPALPQHTHCGTSTVHVVLEWSAKRWSLGGSLVSNAVMMEAGGHVCKHPFHLSRSRMDLEPHFEEFGGCEKKNRVCNDTSLEAF